MVLSNTFSTIWLTKILTIWFLRIYCIFKHVVNHMVENENHMFNHMVSSNMFSAIYAYPDIVNRMVNHIWFKVNTILSQRSRS